MTLWSSDDALAPEGVIGVSISTASACASWRVRGRNIRLEGVARPLLSSDNTLQRGYTAIHKGLIMRV